MLYGEAGIGKTALLTQLVESAPSVEFIRVTGVEAEMELTYAGLHQLCAPLLAHLAAIPVPQRQALETVFGHSDGVAPDAFLVSLAVLSLVGAAAEERPLLGIVDDAQWLDRSSLLTLTFVARRLLAERAGLVFATRELDGPLQELPQLEVTGLRTADADGLLGMALRYTLDERVRAQIVAETGGNPLALLELPHGLTAGELAGGFRIPGTHALSGRIEQSFMRRVDAMPADARTLILLAAAEPTGDPLLLLRAARRLGLGSSATDAAAHEGLLAIDHRVVFRHPLVRSAVYGRAAPEARRAAHLALAQATDEELDPDRRAWHRAAAADGEDEEIAKELVRSAGRAQLRAGLAAGAAFLERAVALTGDPAHLADRALVAAQANVHAGAIDVAHTMLATAEAAPLDELLRARVQLVRGEAALLSTWGGDAPSQLVQAARLLEPLDAALARDTYLDAWGAAVLRGRRLDPECDVGVVCRSARAAPRPQGPPRPTDVMLDALVAAAIDGRGPAEPLLEKAARLFIDDDPPPELILRWGWVAIGAPYLLWDEDRTSRFFAVLLRAHREAGALGRLPLLFSTYSLFAARCGDFRAVEDAVAELEAMPTDPGTTTNLASARMFLAAYCADGPEALTSMMSAYRTAAVSLGQGIGSQLAAWMSAVMCNGQGLHAQALPAAQLASDDSPDLFVSAWATPELLEAAVRCDRSDLAALALERIRDSTSIGHNDAARGIRARSEALMSDCQDADRLFLEAIGHLSRSRLRPDLGRAHLLYGEWLRRDGRDGEAGKQLGAAHDQLSELGMQAFAARARDELAKIGVKVQAGNAETTDLLTSQERQIARLAADGLSNPEIGGRLFLSPRTVEWHLHKVFPKLGIRSRRELAHALVEPTR